MISNWHELSEEVVASITGSDLAQGLTNEGAKNKLEIEGYNELEIKKATPWWLIFLNQFNNILIYVLLVSAVTTLCLGEIAETIVILGVVVINAIFGTIQEKKAEKEIGAIRKILAPTAEVFREGKSMEVPARELVTGDIVYLKSGDVVPADLRLFEVNSLKVRESILTGESNSITKGTVSTAKLASLGDRLCMVYSGTEVISGRGKGVAIATGANTELGKINSMLKNIVEAETPLTRQMAVFANWLTVIIVLLASLTFILGMVFWHQGINEMFLAAVGLAVAAIPEGLPATLTIILALGVQRMAKLKAIVRKLPAVETMGAVTTICTDKTGTLTENIQTVCKIVTVEGQVEVSNGIFKLQEQEIAWREHLDLKFILEGGLLCNDLLDKYIINNNISTGNAVDLALLRLGTLLDLDLENLKNTYSKVDIIPYESEHKLMASLHRNHEGGSFILMKGAPEKILSTCIAEGSNSSFRAINSEYWFNKIDELATQGYRLIALAYKPTEANNLTFEMLEKDFVLVGLLALIDPPRKEIIPAIQACYQANIKVKMITGDYALTAQTIAEQVGIDCSKGILTGAEIDQMEDSDLSEKIKMVNVFARTDPRHKLKLVELLQKQGEVVAMTGDGANDAPALRKADIGLAMGQKGAEVAKEAGEIVLADDNFATIVGAIEAGRIIFDNIRKVILHSLPTNASEAFILVIAILCGTTLPISAIQILWVNMVTSVMLSLTLVFEKAENKIMERAPRNAHKPIFDKWMVQYMGFIILLLIIFVFCIFYYELRFDLDSLATARTATVNMLIFGEAAFLLNCRRLHSRDWGYKKLIKENPIMLGSIVLLCFIQGSFTYNSYMQGIFQTEGLYLKHWLYIIASCAVIFVLAELVKIWLKFRELRQNG